MKYKVTSDTQCKKLDKCVNEFLKDNRLTEENLKKLDDRVVNLLGDDQRSVASHRSAKSQQSGRIKPTTPQRDIRDNVSDAGSDVSLKSIHSLYGQEGKGEEEDEDEWFLISKFNTEL